MKLTTIGLTTLLTGAAGLSMAQVNNYYVSLSSNGDFANERQVYAAVSEDGRYVAYATTADNQVAGDNNGDYDIFRRDLLTGTTELVTNAMGQAIPANGNNARGQIDISADGRFIVFTSTAADLAQPDFDTTEDVFLKDMVTGTCEILSVRATGFDGGIGSQGPRISPDGRFVVFASGERLIPEDISLQGDVYLLDRSTGTLEVISAAATGQPSNGDSFDADLSDDGRYVTFRTTASVISGSPVLSDDVHLVRKDRSTGVFELVNTSASGEVGDREVRRHPRISGDGSTIIFDSDAQNLVPSTSFTGNQLYAKHMASGFIEVVSVDVNGVPLTFHDSSSTRPHAVSFTGDLVTFNSAYALVPGDTNNRRDIYVRSLSLGVTEQVSLTTAGGAINRDCNFRAASSDGNFVVFESLGDVVIGTTPTSPQQLYLTDRSGAFGSFSNYCSTQPNSSGFPAEMRAFGSTDLAENRLTLAATSLPNSAFGFFLASRAQGFVANPAGSAGNLCLGGSIGRFVGPGEIQNAGNTGAFSLAVDLTALPQPGGPTAAAPGESWSFQAWVRDTVAGVATSNFSNGLEVVFQ